LQHGGADGGGKLIRRRNKSFLLLFFKKEERIFFLERKKQRTFTLLVAAPMTIAATLPPTQSAYLEGCGGCHGIDGRSYAPKVPDIAGQAGFYLCTQEGRRYIARLPNVDFAHLDSTQLAAVMNYAVFTLGAGSAPAGAQPFTAAEMAAARAETLDSPDLMGVRARVIAGILKTCPAARGLLAYGAP
jgi:mono/diheme cytochrome c family protein